MFKRVVIIFGVPRSGTSWLGQIFDSCPSVRYRFQPLFSWKFKNALSENSRRDEYAQFFKELYFSNDDFLCQTERRKKGLYPNFKKKSENPEFLVFKMVRFHHLVPLMLDYFDYVDAVGIVRHPCGVIHSWLNNPKEFPKDADPLKEWRHGQCRNKDSRHEHWGFEAWKRVCQLIDNLMKIHPNNMRLVKYEALIDHPLNKIITLFQSLKIPFTEQTRDFLEACHQNHRDDAYAVYKNKFVKDQWKSNLHPLIRDQILNEIKSCEFDKYLKD